MQNGGGGGKKKIKIVFILNILPPWIFYNRGKSHWLKKNKNQTNLFFYYIVPRGTANNIQRHKIRKKCQINPPYYSVHLADSQGSL